MNMHYNVKNKVEIQRFSIWPIALEIKNIGLYIYIGYQKNQWT